MMVWFQNIKVFEFYFYQRFQSDRPGIFWIIDRSKPYSPDFCITGIIFSTMFRNCFRSLSLNTADQYFWNIFKHMWKSHGWVSSKASLFQTLPYSSAQQSIIIFSQHFFITYINVSILSSLADFVWSGDISSKFVKIPSQE